MKHGNDTFWRRRLKMSSWSKYSIRNGKKYVVGNNRYYQIKVRMQAWIRMDIDILSLALRLLSPVYLWQKTSTHNFGESDRPWRIAYSGIIIKVDHVLIKTSLKFINSGLTEKEKCIDEITARSFKLFLEELQRRLRRIEHLVQCLHLAVLGASVE